MVVRDGPGDAPTHASAATFLAALTPVDAAALTSRAIARRFARGQALFHEGQMPDRVVLLRSGLVKVTSTTPAGREVVLAFRGPGELVGELGAIDDEPRSATIVAVEPVEALTLPPREFLAFLEAHPSAALALVRVLSQRLRDADAKRIEFAALNTLGRIAHRLLELCERFGDPEDGTIRIGLPLSQEELAGWTGSSIESVGRALQTMRALHWITTRRREIRVLDLDALRRAAG
jgi:CRP/FNR family transcriptional regulator, cyclic AMP receptor protein